MTLRGMGVPSLITAKMTQFGGEGKESLRASGSVTQGCLAPGRSAPAGLPGARASPMPDDRART